MAVTVHQCIDPSEVDALDVDNPWSWVTTWWRQMDAAMSDPPSRWWVARLDGVPAGFGAAVPLGLAAGGLGIAHLWVPPRWRRRGVATALRAEIDRLVREAGLPGVQYGYDAADAPAAAAVAAWGLTEVARHQESVLDLTAIDVDTCRRTVARVDVDIALLPDPATYDDEHWARLHAFVAARMEEAPDGDGAEEMPAEMLPRLLTESVLAALATRDGAWVGLTWVLRRAGHDDVANTVFTGVSPEWRGAGIASALKCFHALALREHGFRRIHTQNMHGNDPILAANRAMGFVPDSDYVDVVVLF